ncbi:MAG: HNH endonuclease [Nitrospinae bacterium]|nr:HNH endonuclease [Nitrospinota bacterium]MBI3813028.1 HNH endonuclease [Nitrospinota bacterium]
MKDDFNIGLSYSLTEESQSYVLVDDSLLLKIISPNLDIFEMCSDFSGEPIGLASYLIPGLPEQNIPFALIYGVPKPKWNDFKEYIEKILITHNGKKYGPFFLKGKVKDIPSKGNKYPIHELVPVFTLSVINYTDCKILKPTTLMQEKPDIGIEFTWEDYKGDIKKERRRSPISKQMRFEIYHRDDFRCYYCKRHKDELPKGAHLTLDHKIPYSDGGDDSFDNLVTACSECNKGKSNKIVNGI